MKKISLSFHPSTCQADFSCILEQIMKAACGHPQREFLVITCTVMSAGFYCSPFPQKLILVSCTQSLIFLDEGVNVAIFKIKRLPCLQMDSLHCQHFSWLGITSSHIFFFLHFMLKHPLFSGNLIHGSADLNYYLTNEYCVHAGWSASWSFYSQRIIILSFLIGARGRGAPFYADYSQKAFLYSGHINEKSLCIYILMYTATSSTVMVHSTLIFCLH